MPDGNQGAKQRHWSRTFNLTVVVLVLWFIFAFIIPWFAKDLNGISSWASRWATTCAFRVR